MRRCISTESKRLRGLLLELAADLKEVGAGLQLGPNGFKMFDALGITEAVNNVAVFPDALVMRDALSGDTAHRNAARRYIEIPFPISLWSYLSSRFAQYSD